MSLHAPSRPKPQVPLPRTLPQSARKRVEAAIEGHMAAAEALTAFLNEADGDPDDEPSLGSTGRSFNAEFVDQTSWALGSTDDRESGDVQDEPHDSEPDDVAWTETQGRGGQRVSDFEDDEPSLAHTNATNQALARRYFMDGGGACIDAEAEHDGREP